MARAAHQRALWSTAARRIGERLQLRLVVALAAGSPPPPELNYVGIAARLNLDPVAVLNWPEQVTEDVLMFLNAQIADEERRRRMRL